MITNVLFLLALILILYYCQYSPLVHPYDKYQMDWYFNCKYFQYVLNLISLCSTISKFTIFIQLLILINFHNALTILQFRLQRILTHSLFQHIFKSRHFSFLPSHFLLFIKFFSITFLSLHNLLFFALSTQRHMLHTFTYQYIHIIYSPEKNQFD